MRPSRPLFTGLLLWLLLLGLSLPPAGAQPAPFSPEKAQQNLTRLEQALSRPGTNLDTLNAGLQESSTFLEQSEKCLAAGETDNTYPGNGHRHRVAWFP